MVEWHEYYATHVSLRASGAAGSPRCYHWPLLHSPHLEKYPVISGLPPGVEGGRRSDLHVMCMHKPFDMMPYCHIHLPCDAVLLLLSICFNFLLLHVFFVVLSHLFFILSCHSHYYHTSFPIKHLKQEKIKSMDLVCSLRFQEAPCRASPFPVASPAMT